MVFKKIPEAKVFSFTQNDTFIEKDDHFYEILKNECEKIPSINNEKRIKKKSKVLEFYLNLSNNLLKQIRKGAVLKNKRNPPPFSSPSFQIERIYRVK